MVRVQVSTEFDAFPSDDPDARTDSELAEYGSAGTLEPRYERPPAYIDPADLPMEDLETVAHAIRKWRALRDPVG